jgi:AraC-like DNA-binding protein
MRSAPTLGTALMDLCENQRRYVRGSVAYLLVQDGIAYLGYTLHVSMAAAEQMCEGALAIGASLLRELAGVSPVAVQIARSAPPATTSYREVFGVAPQFDADQYAICFPADLLKRPVRSADRELRALLERKLTDYRPLATPSAAERVTRIVHARATLGDTSLPAIAEALGLHPRTLNRHLLNEGTSFRALREQARLQVARHLLAGTRLPVTQIALALGFGETSSFTHAFQRAAGIAPAKWRAGLRASSG